MVASKKEIVRLLRYPNEWLTYEMYPDELYAIQLACYRPGDEEGSEHDRNGAFHWWLKRSPTKEELTKLIKLTLLDPDPLMGADVRKHIRAIASSDLELARLIDEADLEAKRTIGGGAGHP